MIAVLTAPDPSFGFRSDVRGRGLGEEAARLRDLWRRAAAHRTEPWSSRTPSVEARFRELRDVWKRETGPISSFSRLVLHPAYQRIVGLGEAVLPFLLREMAERPDHWGWALSAIAGVDPVDPNDAGRLDRIAEAWTRWGRERGFLRG